MNGSYTCKRKRLYAAAPGRKCMCIKSYRTNLAGELLLNKGDIVESMSLKFSFRFSQLEVLCV